MSEFNFNNYTDEELVRSWNYHETLKGTDEVFARMDAIDAECNRRGIIAWTGEGQITERRVS